MDDILLDLFREDATGQLEALDQAMVEAEGAADATDALTRCMRAAHSLKGAARVVGLDAIVAIAHAMEDGFEGARQGRITLDRAAWDHLLAATDTVRTLAGLGGDAPPEMPTPEDPAIVALVADLVAIGRGEAPSAPAAAAPPADAPAAPAPEAPVAAPADAPAAAAPAEAAPAPTEAAPVPSAEAAPAPSAGGSGSGSGGSGSGGAAIKVSPEAIGRLMSLSAEVSVELRRLERHVDALAAIGRSLDRAATQLRPLRDDAAIDRRLQLALREIGGTSGRLGTLVEDLERLSTVAQRAADDLHHDVLATRLRPFSDITGAFPRLVRDLARQLGKQVRLEIVGRETEVDRDILAALEAPLGHLLRNALDHALEPPDERRAAGKTEEGRLTIAAAHRGGALVVEVRDDGRGIDAEKVRARAIDRGLVDATLAAELGEAEILEFLFLPGFSTAATVTDISGRGVGLDVVQSMAHAAGGAAKVRTRMGAGTTFSLDLPVTRSVLRCLLVTIAGEPWAVPLSNVDRLLRVTETDLVTVEGRHCVRVDDETVGLITAASVLGLPSGTVDGGGVPVIILTDGRVHHGLEVEGFIGERDLVVRPLDRRFGKVPDLLAAALLDDGTPVLILDPDDLVRSIGEGVGNDGLRRTRVSAAARARAARRVLVVDDSLTVREVERQLLERQGYLVEQAVDGMAGWNALRLGEFDLLVTDVDMPRMNGIELTRRVRADARLGTLPVIIVSYKDREEDRLAGLEAGADRYLTKSSFTDDSLVAAVAELIAGRARRP
ncbi:MAG: response regulator [Chloroflexota bacterium]